MLKTVQKTAHQLTTGDVVVMSGGRFQITGEPKESSAHRPEGYWPASGVGPSACVASPSVCLEGVVKGYFEPGSHWSFQGNTRALFAVEVK